MSLSTSEAVRETYRLALRQNIERKLKTTADWDRYTGIVKDSLARSDQENAAYRAEFEPRLAKAREVVLREQTARRLDHPKPSWAEDTTPSAEQIDTLARNRVQGDHEQRLAAIRTDEMDHYRDFAADLRRRDSRAAEAREQRQDHAKDAFALTNEVSPHGAQTRAPNRGRTGPTQT